MNLIEFARNKEELKRIKKLQDLLRTGGHNIKIYKHYICISDRYVIANDKLTKFVLQEYLGVNEFPDSIIYLRNEIKKYQRIQKFIDDLNNRYSGIINVEYINGIDNVYVWTINLLIEELSDMYNFKSNEIILTLLSTSDYKREYDEFLRKFLQLHFRVSKFSFLVIKSEKKNKVSSKAKFILNPVDNTIYVIRRGDNV